MPGRSPAEALRNYARPIMAALHCITESRLTYGLSVDGVQSNLTLPSEHTQLPRRDGQSNLSLNFVQWYRVHRIMDNRPQRSFEVVKTSWEYAIHDTSEREILAYHWHPESVSKAIIPHFHVGSAIVDATGHEMGKTFSRLHLPSGQVTIADVVRALIEEFGVQPIHDRWDETLRACQEAFSQ